MSFLAGDQFACASLVMRHYTNSIKLGIICEHVIPCSRDIRTAPKKGLTKSLIRACFNNGIFGGVSRWGGPWVKKNTLCVRVL